MLAALGPVRCFADDSAVFAVLPKPPGYTSPYGPYFFTTCVSQNGLYIGGYVCDNEYGANGLPFIYHVGDSGLTMPTLLANDDHGLVVWVSDDGNTAYGGCANSSTNTGTAVVWQGGSPTDLGPNGFSPLSANGLYGEIATTYSGNSATAVCDSLQNIVGYLGPIDGIWGGGNSVSNDGRSAFSTLNEGYNQTVAVRWQGVPGQLYPGARLPFLNSTDLLSWADAMSPDGSTIVGYDRDQNSVDHPVRWTQNGSVIQDLGLPYSSGSQTVRLWSCSTDGSILAGTDFSGSPTYYYPFFWTSRTGWKSVSSALGDFGSYINYSNQDSLEIYLSGDGRTVASRNWYARFPLVSGASDSYYIAAGHTLHVPANKGVLVNDANVTNGSAILGTAPHNGSLNLNGDGSFDYTAATAASTESFTYQPAKSFLAGAPTKVTLHVRPAYLNSMSVYHTSVVGIVPSTGTVTFNPAVPTGGITLKIYSSNPNAAVPPTSIFAAEGTTLQTFSIRTIPVQFSTNVTITADSQDGNTKSAVLTVTPAVLAKASFNFTSIAGGNVVGGRVTLNAPASSFGAQVTLQSNNAEINVPPSVTIGPLAQAAVFAATTTNVSTNTQVSVTATYQGISQTAYITLTPVVLYSVTPSILTAHGTTSLKIYVSLDGPAPAGGAQLMITSSDPTVLPMPTPITIPAGVRRVGIATTTHAPSTQETVTLGVTYGSTTKSCQVVVDPT